jgi:hypothetical protein
MSESNLSYDAILDIIHAWPAAQRCLLVQEVLKTLESENESTTKRDTLSLALGLLTTDGPSPSDEEIAQWLDAHRLEKYG